MAKLTLIQFLFITLLALSAILGVFIVPRASAEPCSSIPFKDGCTQDSCVKECLRQAASNGTCADFGGPVKECFCDNC
ncbi:hypothetical protein ACHQM5_024871 [Ranunculus cassubicifolius]